MAPGDHRGSVPGRTVAAVVLEVLASAGARTAFALPGVHNLAFWRDAGPGRPELVVVRHEQTTVYAADGYARATGGLGVALTTTGPGAANAVAAFGEAASSGSPVVLVASEISTRLARPGVMRGVLHESRDQAAIFEPLAKAVLRPRDPAAAVRAAAEAVRIAIAWPRGPVYVDIPTDVLEAPAPGPVPVIAPSRFPPATADLDRAAEAVERARRIVIWAGGGVVQADAGAEVAALAERLGAPVVTTFGGRGVIGADHPWLVGLPPHEPDVAAYVGDADLMLAVGTTFDGQMTRNWTMPRPESLVAINVSPADLTASYSPDVAVLGDARLALAGLLARLGERRSDDAELRALRSGAWRRLRADAAGGPGLAFVTAVEGAVEPVDATVVVDMTVPGYWYGGYARVTGPRRLQYPIGWGTLGYALPAALGAAHGVDRPVLALCGDGGLMYALGELATLVQERSAVTVLCVDDGGYGMLRYDQDRAGEERRGVDLVRPDFAALAAAFGIPAVVLDDVAGLQDALRTAFASGEPRMVVLRLALTPPRTTSPRWQD